MADLHGQGCGMAHGDGQRLDAGASPGIYAGQTGQVPPADDDPRRQGRIDRRRLAGEWDTAARARGVRWVSPSQPGDWWTDREVEDGKAPADAYPVEVRP